jgi:hypothetical protein
MADVNRANVKKSSKNIQDTFLGRRLIDSIPENALYLRVQVPQTKSKRPCFNDAIHVHTRELYRECFGVMHSNTTFGQWFPLTQDHFGYNPKIHAPNTFERFCKSCVKEKAHLYRQARKIREVQYYLFR